MGAGPRIALPMVALVAAGCAPLPPAAPSSETPSPVESHTTNTSSW